MLRKLDKSYGDDPPDRVRPLLRGVASQALIVSMSPGGQSTSRADSCGSRTSFAFTSHPSAQMGAGGAWSGAGSARDTTSS
jgi:hypothetical protein